jgi:hypothetical protein
MRHYSTRNWFLLYFICGNVALGCGKKEEASPDPTGPAAAAKEDPAVSDHVKKKGWSLNNDLRVSDDKPVVILSVGKSGNPLEKVTLAPDDYQMIAKSKTVQVLDLSSAKEVSDDGLKALVDIPQLLTIAFSDAAVTDASMKILAKCKSLDSVILRGTKKVTDAGIKELAALPNLKFLYVGLMNLDGSGFEPFAGAKTLRSLTLEFVDGLNDDGAKHLAKIPNLDELKIGKGFAEQKLTSAGIKTIVAARVPAKFEFDRRLLDDDLLEMLVAKGWLYGPSPADAKEKRPASAEEVRYLGLTDCKVTDKGVRAVLNCTNATSIHLGNTGVTDETVKKLAAFKKLDYLDLEKTKVTAAGLDAVVGLPLKHLSVQGCELSEDAFKAIGKMSTLEALWLSNTKMKADWLKHLTGLVKLRELNLRSADCDDDAVKYLAALPSVTELVLNDTKLGDKGFQELIKLPKLTNLLVDGTKVSKEVYLKAKKDHPKLRLYYYRYDQSRLPTFRDLGEADTLREPHKSECVSLPNQLGVTPY